MTDATDVAWLSGIIDGEGCVYAKQNFNKVCDFSRSY
jgi:hypothetical protein